MISALERLRVLRAATYHERVDPASTCGLPADPHNQARGRRTDRKYLRSRKTRQTFRWTGELISRSALANSRIRRRAEPRGSG